MALRDVLSRFRSISRPSLLGSSSSAYSSLAKKTLLAEDVIIDNQYEAGDLSAEYYLNRLQERMNRGTLTPLQKVTLGEKIKGVESAVLDADVSRRYSSGELTTDQVLAYEKSKLQNMSEPTSVAYIKQQQKVQSLQDKAEKEARAQFRISENLRISRLPEDSSENMWEKARLYQTLSDQARLDGDTSQADQLLTQANNYVNSARKADVNDIITGARLSVSETPNQGSGVASSEGGSSFLSSLSGSGTAVSGVGKATPSAVTTTNYQTPAIKNKLESLDRQQKTYERLIAQKQDNQTLIQSYQEAVARATGDQKTSLQISLNNLIETGNGIDNQLSNTTQNIQDTVLGIQELQQKTAFSNEKKTIVNFENLSKKDEDVLEKAFQKGEIDKQTYISQAIDLAKRKAELFEYAGNVYSQFGDDVGVERYVEKSNDIIATHDNLVGVGNNLDDYEPIVNESNGKITNIFGQRMNPGEVALTDVSELKNSKVFDTSYVNKNGSYYKIHFPATLTDSNGNLLPQYLTTALAKKDNLAFINTFDAESGKRVPVKIGFLKDQKKDDQGNVIIKPYELDTINKLRQVGAVTESKSGELNLIRERATPFLGIYGTPQELATGFGKGVVRGVTELVDKAKNAFGLSGNKTSFRLPEIVKTANASELVPGGVSGQVGDIIDQVAEQMKPGDLEFKKVLHAIALAESGGNPNAIGDRGESIGLFQNRMIKGRGANFSKEQLLDPQFNTELAANELVKYYDQAQSKGLKGANLVAYVSKYGQRPAAGLESNAAAKYGQFVSTAIKGIKNTFSKDKNTNEVQAKDYTTESLANPARVRDIELALGLKSGQYRTGLKQDQAAVDRAFRSDQRTQELLRSEGLKPSWEAQSVSAPTQPIAPVVAQRQQQNTPSNNVLQNIGSGISSGISNAVQKVQSGVTNFMNNTFPQIKIPQYQPKLISPIVEPKKPNIIQQAINTVKSNPVVQNISNAVKNVASSISNLFKRK